MGSNLVSAQRDWKDHPESNVVPSYDPLAGFSKSRKERESVLTLDEMRAANIPKRFRDFCAHKYLDLQVCQRESIPLPSSCSHELHAYDMCIRDDYILRMKEYERERRLRRRQRAKEEAAKTAAAAS